MHKSIIFDLLNRSETVFSAQELSLLYPGILPGNLTRRLSYLVKTGQLKKVRRGFFTRERYEFLELANKIYKPSYISLETVLEKSGIVFQVYNKTVFLVSYLSRKLEIDGREIIYRKVADFVLLNPVGIEVKNNYSIASKERAFLDAAFLNRNYHFDNLGVLDWEKTLGMVDIYKDKSLVSVVDKYYQEYKRQYV